MIYRNTFIKALFLFTIFIGFSQCKSTSESVKIEKTIRIENNKTQQVYSQNWVAGVRGGGSGLNLVLSKSFLKEIVPIEVYFRNKITSVEEKQYDFVAYYKGTLNQLKDINEEVENPIIISSEAFPFDLEDNEAIISYLNNGETIYLKISNISQKESIAYPSTRPQN